MAYAWSWHILYDIYIVNIVRAVGLFGYGAGDVRSFRASAEIPYQIEFAQVYDLNIQEKHQSPYAYISEPHSYLEIIPIPYYPKFAVLFGIFLLFTPLICNGLWSIINIVFMILYFRHFVRAVGLEGKVGNEIIFLLAVSLSVFLNALFGQVNILFLYYGRFGLSTINLFRFFLDNLKNMPSLAEIAYTIGLLSAVLFLAVVLGMFIFRRLKCSDIPRLERFICFLNEFQPEWLRQYFSDS